MISKAPNTNLQIQPLFPVRTNAGGKVDTSAVPTEDSKNAASATAKLRQAKASKPQIQALKDNTQGLQSPVSQANTANFRTLTNFQLEQTEAIQVFQASLGNINAPKAEFKFDGSFNVEDAKATLDASAKSFTGSLLTSTTDAQINADDANNAGNEALSSLDEASGLLGGGLGSIVGGGTKIATSIPMFSNPWTILPAIALAGAGTLEITQGGQEVFKGQETSENAENTGENATATYTATAEDLKNNSTNLEQLNTFYTGVNNSVFPTLADAESKNQKLFALGDSLGANVQAPENPASPAGASNGMAPTTPATNTGFVAPSATPAFNLSDASWATPVTPLTGASTPTIQALGVSPLAGGNSQEANAQAGGLTAEEKQFMTAFQANRGIVDSANGEAERAKASAPQGFNKDIPTTVADASQSQGLQELYARLQAKEQEAQKQNNGLQVPKLGQNAPQNALAPQEPLVNPVDPNAVAQAPQDLAQRSLIIPSFAPKAPALQPALV